MAIQAPSPLISAVLIPVLTAWVATLEEPVLLPVAEPVAVVAGNVKLGMDVASTDAMDCRLVAAGGVYCTMEEDIAAREEVASAELDAPTLTVVVV